MSAKRPASWLRVVRRLVVVLGGGLLVLFLFLQITLATPWARNKVSAEITRRTGLECKLGRLSWTPWGGASMRDLKIAQPSALADLTDRPLVSVRLLRVHPRYGDCLRGALRIRGLEVEQPEVSLSVEMLAAIVGRNVPAPIEPPLLATEAVPAPARLPAPRPVRGPDRMPLPGPDGAPIAPPEVAGVGESAGAKVQDASSFPFEMEVKEGRFEVFSATESWSLGLARNASLSISKNGSGLDGEIRVEEIAMLGNSIETEVFIEVASSAKGLIIEILENSEKKKQLTGNVIISPSGGLPLGVDVSYRRLSTVSWSFPGAGVAEMNPFQVTVQALGFGQIPSSWRGILRVEGDGFEVVKHSLGFDRYSGTIVWQGGLMQAQDFRFVGDSVSLLGNGWVSRDSGAAVVRAVVPEQFGPVIGERFRLGAFQKLEPGDRSFLDLSLWRSPEGWMVEGGGESRPVSDLAKAFLGDGKPGEARQDSGE